MPFRLETRDVLPELAHAESVLIVPCRFCPAASMAVEHDQPYIEFPRRLLKTESYEHLLRSMKCNLESLGIEVNVFKSSLLHQFVLCMWTTRRRRKLLRQAQEYEAVVVMGCEAAVQTVRSALESTACRVIQGMASVGIMSVQPRLSFPCNLSLELEGVTPYVQPAPQVRR